MPVWSGRASGSFLPGGRAQCGLKDVKPEVWAYHGKTLSTEEFSHPPLNTGLGYCAVVIYLVGGQACFSQVSLKTNKIPHAD